MTDATNVFAERYRNKSTRNLARLVVEQDNLVPQAREALQAEIARRPQFVMEAPVSAEPNLDGVRGWLLLYCLDSVYASIRLFFGTLAMNTDTSIPIGFILFTLAVAGWDLAIGLAIFFRSRFALRMVLIQLILGAVATAILLAARIASPAPVDDFMKLLILESILNVVLILMWYRYFRVSQRVLITLGRNL